MSDNFLARDFGQTPGGPRIDLLTGSPQWGPMTFETNTAMFGPNADPTLGIGYNYGYGGNKPMPNEASMCWMVEGNYDRSHAGIPDAVMEQFWFRCGLDRSVLTQFGREFGLIDPRNGPPICWIVDAGANIGVFSALARRLYPGAEILALEVEPENYAFLVKNAEALGHITPVNAALWSESGRVSLILGDNPEAHAVTDRPEPGAQQVAATSLGDLLRTYGWDNIDILNMDIESAEAAVIGSLGRDLIGRINCIRVECNHTEAPGNFLAMAKGLLAADFDSYAFDENEYFIRRSTGWAFRRRYPGVADIPCYPAA